VCAVDRIASVREYSQFKDEDKCMFLPCSFVQPSGEYRTEIRERGTLLVVTNLNLLKHDGTSPVFIAALHGHASCIEVLVSLGVDAQIPRSDGTTPLQIARQQHHRECVDVLEVISNA
jgi:hypothetical protein